jgi:hypothetical protein
VRMCVCVCMCVRTPACVRVRRVSGRVVPVRARRQPEGGLRASALRSRNSAVGVVVNFEWSDSMVSCVTSFEDEATAPPLGLEARS